MFHYMLKEMLQCFTVPNKMFHHKLLQMFPRSRKKCSNVSCFFDVPSFKKECFIILLKMFQSDETLKNTDFKSKNICNI
jgi:hypothetical protein